MFVNGNGGTFEVDFEAIERCKADLLGKTSLQKNGCSILMLVVA